MPQLRSSANSFASAFLSSVLLVATGTSRRAATLAPEAVEARDQHNRYRALNQALNLAWDTSIEASALAYAATCPASHAVGTQYGENLYWSAAPGINISDIIYRWWIEIELYNFNNPVYDSATGHFTQVVWQATTSLGCGFRTDCSISIGGFVANNVFVCRYLPPGNFVDEFATNVLPVNCRHWPYEVQAGLQCVCTEFTVKDASTGRCCPRFAQYNSATNTCGCPAGLSFVNISGGGKACCPANSAWSGTWDGGNCVCNSGFFWNGSVCAAGDVPICPPFAVWNGAQCVCPSGTYYTGEACCPFDSVWDPAAKNCVCRATFYWTGQVCCPVDAVYVPSAGFCACRSGFYWTGSLCCPVDAIVTSGGVCACRAGFYWTGQACCPYDAVFDSTTGSCICRRNFYWTGQACCPYDATFDSAAGVCVCRAGFYWAGRLCCPVNSKQVDNVEVAVCVCNPGFAWDPATASCRSQ